MARDVSTNGAMNDLPTPGQPDFDLNTMRLQQMHGPYPLVHKPSFVPPTPVADQNDISGTVPPQAPIDVEPLLAKVMASTPQQAAAPPAPPIPQLKPGSAKQQTVSADFVPTPGAGGTMMGRSVQQLVDNNKKAAAEGQPAPHLPSGGAGLSTGQVVAGGGTAALLAAILYRLMHGGGAGAGNEIGKVLSLGGKEVAPALEDYRVPAYADDTIAPATDEARMRVNDASGGQPVNQATQDKVQRQIDIDAGTIQPQDYLAGEKPKPGTPGYKIWFKSRQDAAKAKK